MSAGHEGEGLAGFLGSDHGALVATVLHWLGALLFVAGVLTLLVQIAHRRREGGPGGPDTLAERSPALAAALILAGIALALIGGFMRLLVPSHPTLDHLTTSTWVQALFTKHMGLVLGMGSSVVLLAAATPLLAHRFPALQRATRPQATEVLGAIALLGIAMATILGAVATTVAVPGEAPAMAVEFPALKPADLGTQRTLWSNATGAITGTPAQAGEAVQALEVPPDTREVRFDLAWASQAAALRLEVLDPDGQPADIQPATAATRVAGVLAAPAPGTWTVRVLADRAVAEEYQLAIALDVEQRFTSRFEGTLEVPAGEPVEMLLRLPAGGRFRYDYALAMGGGLTFSVHRDEPAEDTVPASEGPAGNGTVVSADGGDYGLVLASADGAAVALRLVGVFELLDAPMAPPMEDGGHSHG